MDKDVAKVLDWMDRWASGDLKLESRLQRMSDTLDGAIEADEQKERRRQAHEQGIDGA